MVLNVPLQLVEEMNAVSRETCLNFVYFRNSLKSHRVKCDDRINQRLSSLTNLKDQCPKFAENLRKAQESRMRNLKFCISVLNESGKLLEGNDNVNTKENHVVKKEKGLLESEIAVEEIVCEQMLYCPVDKCEQDSPFSTTKQLLEHLENRHEIKIHEPAAVAPFIDQYLKSYEEILQEEGCPRIIGGNEALFPDDLIIRQNLTSKMLNGLLQTQQMERNTIYKRARMCLFCSEISSNLHELFAHMFQNHHFNIGLLDNLIFIETFLNELEEMTKFKKQCLFCMETFRNGTCLRKHMKSKNHFKISGKDERWDQFYLINYVNLNNKSNNFVNSNDNVNFKNEPEPLEEEDNNWDDLDDEIDLQTQCLFCNEILSNPEDCFIHMQNLHSFNMKKIQREHNLKFYDTMKLINYFRNCQREDIEAFEDCNTNGADAGGTFLKQKFEKNQIPSAELWNRPEFYFPVYEEDPLLTAIESDDDEEIEI